MENTNIKFQIVKNTFRLFFGPTLVSSIALSIISITDMAIAGQLLGGSALSAISIVYPIILLVLILSSLFGMGSAIRLSTQLGLGDRDGCNQTISNALVLAAGSSIIIAAIGLALIRPILFICGATNEHILELSKTYLTPILIGLVFMVLSPLVMTLLRNDSNPKLSMRIVLCCGVVNLLLDIILGKKLGLAGIAWATVIAELLAVIIGLYFLYVRNGNVSLVRPKLSLIGISSITIPGLPVAMIFALQAVLTAFINNVLMSCGGEEAVAVYAIIKNLIGFIYAFYDGITGSMQPMLGIYYGAGENKNVNYVLKVAFRYMALLSIGLFLVLEIFAPFICNIFGAEGSLLESSTKAIRIQAFFCFSAGFLACINAFYRCTGREKLSLGITLLDNLIIDIPVILILRNLSGSMYCVFVGLVLTDIITIIIWFIAASVARRKSGSKRLLALDEAEQQPCIFERSFLTRDQEVGELLDSLQESLDSQDVSMKKAYYINLCMEELVVNIIQLSKESRDVYVDIAITRCYDDSIQLRIRDNLVKFDPTAVKDASANDMDEDEDFNAMGLTIVKRIAKEYAYKRTIGMNDFRVIL